MNPIKKLIGWCYMHWLGVKATVDDALNKTPTCPRCGERFIYPDQKRHTPEECHQRCETCWWLTAPGDSIGVCKFDGAYVDLTQWCHNWKEKEPK